MARYGYTMGCERAFHVAGNGNSVTPKPKQTPNQRHKLRRSRSKLEEEGNGDIIKSVVATAVVTQKTRIDNDKDAAFVTPEHLDDPNEGQQEQEHDDNDHNAVGHNLSPPPAADADDVMSCKIPAAETVITADAVLSNSTGHNAEEHHDDMNNDDINDNDNVTLPIISSSATGGENMSHWILPYSGVPALTSMNGDLSPFKKDQYRLNRFALIIIQNETPYYIIVQNCMFKKVYFTEIG